MLIYSKFEYINESLNRNKKGEDLIDVVNQN